MVDGQIRTFDVTDQAVIKAFSAVPREAFLPASLRDLAYSDAVLTLPGRTPRMMLQPMHLARLIQGASVQPADRVLVVAGGSGYAAAIAAHLGARVVTIEADADLTSAASAACRSLGLTNVQAVTGDLAAGHAAAGPYDVILIPGGIETNIAALLAQLSPSGRLLAITTKSGDAARRGGRAVRVQTIAGEVSERFLFDAAAPVITEFRAVGAFIF